jgi:hypothetical protein
MKLVKGRYSIEYANGIKQEKNLISHKDYIGIIKPLRDAADYFDSIKNEQMENALKAEIKKLVGSDDFFTDESGLYEAHKTGILNSVEHMGGPSKCIVTKIKN